MRVLLRKEWKVWKEQQNLQVRPEHCGSETRLSPSLSLSVGSGEKEASCCGRGRRGPQSTPESATAARRYLATSVRGDPSEWRAMVNHLLKRSRAPRTAGGNGSLRRLARRCELRACKSKFDAAIVCLHQTASSRLETSTKLPLEVDNHI